MIWENYNFLWLLLLIPGLALFLWWKRKEFKARKEQYFSTELFSTLRTGFWPLGKRLKNIFLLSGFSFLILAMAGPKIGTEVREIKRQGIDMLVALDLSASMKAEDVRPSRLEKAKFEINRLIERLQGDRVGLIVFTGEAYLQSPMTQDYSALRLFLDIAETDQMPSSATDFNAALTTAKEAFDALEDTDSEASKVLLIISDGEDHGQSYEGSLQNLVDDNIKVFTIGIGTTEGTTIPLYEEGTNQFIGYKRDREGRIVTTKLQSQTLRNIANTGNGEFYSIRRGNEGLDSFLARMDDLEKGEYASQEYADYKNQYQWMAALAFLCIVAALVIPSYRKENS